MSKCTLLIVTLLVVALPTFALAAWNATSSTSYPQCQGLSQEMSDCKNVVPTSTTELNNQNLMCPMVMPVETSTANNDLTISPMSAQQSMPQDAATIMILTPVSIQQINGNDAIVCSMSSDFANSVVLVPMSSNGKQMMAPMQLKQSGQDLMILVPLDKTIAAPAQMSLMVDGNTCLVPMDTPASFSSDTLCVDANDQGKMNVMSDKNKY